jgi:hypothetical protein
MGGDVTVLVAGHIAVLRAERRRRCGVSKVLSPTAKPTPPCYRKISPTSSSRSPKTTRTSSRSDFRR